MEWLLSTWVGTNKIWSDLNNESIIWWVWTIASLVLHIIRVHGFNIYLYIITVHQYSSVKQDFPVLVQTISFKLHNSLIHFHKITRNQFRLLSSHLKGLRTPTSIVFISQLHIQLQWTEAPLPIKKVQFSRVAGQLHLHVHSSCCPFENDKKYVSAAHITGFIHVLLHFHVH